MAHIETISHLLKRLVVIGVALAASGAIAHSDERPEKTYGKPGDRVKASRTVEIAMSDEMRFTPASITARKGETIRFVVNNSGKLKHEMVLGSIRELKAHAALMLKSPEMEHADPNQISVDPGKTGELIWQFTNAGTFDFACLQPGHFEAGMRGKITVK